MVSVLLVVGACGGPGLGPDAGPPDARPDAPPDADPGAFGTWIDTYYPSSGPVTASACNGAPGALVVDPSSAQAASYGGTCHADGSFVVHTPAGVNDYYLKVGGRLFATAAHSGLDLSTDHLGRADVTPAPGAMLSLNLTGMTAWALGDVVMAWSANVGFYETLAFSAGPPGSGDTALAATAPWYGYKIDGAKSDVLQLFQLATHQTAGGVSYLTLDRTYDVAAFTMPVNQTTAIPASGSAAFSTPGASSSLLSLDVASYDGLAAAAAPAASSRAIATTIYAAVTQDVIPSPPLFMFSRDSSSLATLDFGNLHFGDPFPAWWQRRVKVTESFTQTYTFNGATGTLAAEVATIVPFADAQLGAISAKLGPPTAITVDGVAAPTADTISMTPAIAWSTPALGTATDYELTIYEARSNNTSLDFTPQLHLVTKATSVRLPYGYLLPQRQYVVVVTAHARANVDVSLTPFRAGLRSSSADALSALLST
jgi:hypothetical protein